MGAAVTIYNLRLNEKLYKKWTKLDKPARQYMLDIHLDVEITEDTWKEGIKKWRKQQKQSKKDN